MNFKSRIEKFQNKLKENDIDFFLLDDQTSILYLTGLKISFGKIIISKNESILFTDNRYFEGIRNISSMKVEIFSKNKVFEFLKKNLQNKNILAVDNTKFTIESFEKLKQFLNEIKRDINIEIIATKNPIYDLRAIKDIDEINIMKKAASITWEGFKHLCNSLKENMTEKDLALDFEIFVRQNFAEKLSFDPIVAFGKNSAIPHHRISNTKLKLNDIILLDLGVVYENYCSDFTRVIFFGNPDPKLEEIYNITKKAQLKAISICKPGVSIRALDIEARKVFIENNVEDLFIHGLGHGVGLDIHEFPKVSKDGLDKDVILKKSMVITIEPGLYIPNLGGVRYEDIIHITQDGCENFYSSI
ncbi:MAG: Aminopeptidase YpdF [Candidatus Anoxychlamydiales bacterium]|nr:Aminopeptidase YpdF [Candidatus Anoxychlamydiales bacterium]